MQPGGRKVSRCWISASSRSLSEYSSLRSRNSRTKGSLICWLGSTMSSGRSACPPVRLSAWRPCSSRGRCARRTGNRSAGRAGGPTIRFAVPQSDRILGRFRSGPTAAVRRRTRAGGRPREDRPSPPRRGRFRIRQTPSGEFAVRGVEPIYQTASGEFGRVDMKDRTGACSGRSGASSITSALFSDGVAGKSKVSRLLTAGKRAARIRRSTMRWCRSMSSSSARRSRYWG